MEPFVFVGAPNFFMNERLRELFVSQCVELLQEHCSKEDLAIRLALDFAESWETEYHNHPAHQINGLDLAEAFGNWITFHLQRSARSEIDQVLGELPELDGRRPASTEGIPPA